MVYFVFDLDQTLADLEDADYKTITTYKNNSELYPKLVKEYAERETGPDPIGLLRFGLVRSPFLPPGFKPYMEQILQLKQLGICQGVIIYSNNGCLECLHFVKDVIHMILGVNDLFCQCIHRKYPGRPYSQIGNPPKTWTELKMLVETANTSCAINRFVPENVVFFDDLPDHKLRLQPRLTYVTVLPYKNIRSDSEHAVELRDIIRNQLQDIAKQNNINYTAMNDTSFINLYNMKVLESDARTIQTILNRYTSSDTPFSSTAPSSASPASPASFTSPSVGGKHYNYTLNNRLKQKKQQRKRKYKKNSRKHKK